MAKRENYDERLRLAGLFPLLAGALWGILFCAVVWLLCGCASAKPTVTERVTHDTIRTVARDTVWQDRFVERIVERVRREATSVRDSTVRTVDKDGNVVKEEHWRGEKTRESSEETELYKDSAAMWKARYEEAVRARTGEDKTVVEKGKAMEWHWWNVAAAVMLAVVAVGAVVKTKGKQ